MNGRNDFDGCHRKCRTRGEHSLEYGGCEYADKPEPTVSMSKVYTDYDGHPSIGYDQYTVQQLADLIEPALRNADVEVSADWFPDLAQAAAHAIVHRNDGPSVPHVTLRLAEHQTCGVCGAGNRVGTECTSCAFQVRMDTETCKHDADRHDPKAGCIECRYMSTTGHDVNDSTVTEVDRPVGSEGELTDSDLVAAAREIGLVEPDKAPEIVAAARKLVAQSGVDTPGCDCDHEGMGPAWHLKTCAWLATRNVPHPDAATVEEPEVEVRCGGCGHHEGEGCGCPPPVPGIRGLLEHVGIDATGKDIRVGDRVVDAWPHSCGYTVMRCNGARVRMEHGQHDWEPQPGMTPLHCRGWSPVEAGPGE